MSEWKTKILALESDLDAKHGEATELNKNISRVGNFITVSFYMYWCNIWLYSVDCRGICAGMC